MRIYTPDRKLDIDIKKGCAIALGSFDSLHLGHQELIKSAVLYAKNKNLLCGAYMFLQRPEWVISGINGSDQILSNPSKAKILAGYGLDFAYFDDFNRLIMEMTCEEFVGLLVDRFNIKCAVVGFNYSFGKAGLGDANTLKSLGKKYGFEVIIINAVKEGGMVISSSNIRTLIKSGDVQGAAKLLGRYFFIEGKVTEGKKLGRKLGYPTANIKTDNSTILPSFGVYAAFAYLNNQRYNCAVNVGFCPTIGNNNVTVESHILDFSKDIYNKPIKLEFVKKLRDEIKFDSLDALKLQLPKDIEAAKKVLTNQVHI